MTSLAPLDSPRAVGLTATVVVCTYSLDRLADLTACLSGVTEQRRPADDVLVVVDHHDELAELLRTRDDIRVIENRFARGLSGARNTAVEVALGDVVVFLDDDAVPDPDWLAEILVPFDNPSVAVVGGHIEPAWPTARPGWFPPHLDWTIGCSIPTLPADIGVVRNVYGASAAFRRDRLVAVDGFPAELGRNGSDAAGCEETDVCIRIRQADPNALVMYAPGSNVHHRVTEQRATTRYVIRRCFGEGVSKARLARRVGGDDATSDERGYAVVILKTAMLDLLGALVEPIRAARAAVLVVGLGAAASGFALESLRFLLRRRGPGNECR
jgi:glucosyl-dolichyl phosphate glucuronosyltransferase